MADLPNQPWTIASADLFKKLDVSEDDGLSDAEVQQRREKHGANRLKEAQRRGPLQILIEQFKSLVIGILAIAAILSFAFAQWIEGIAIVFAILINAAIGFFMEYQAVRSMEALQSLSSSKAKVRRQGQMQEIDAENLVPGDMVLLESGDMIPADLRLTDSSQMQVNESSLTGESVPVSKTTEPIEGDVELADRTNMLFKGTALSRGSGEGVVVATGMQTELGHISELAQEANTEERTPLEKRLNQLGRRLIWVTLVIVALIAISGIIVGKDIRLMVETSVALAVAAIPEGLPIVATIALARGMWRMAKRNALINKLAAVETLGATSVICTDKTGTLTENRMTVSHIVLDSGDVEISGEGLEPEGKFTQDDETLKPLDHNILRPALEVGVLCNNAALQPEDSNESRVVGDPMEVALLIAGAKADLKREELLEDMPEVREEAFDPDTKMMATLHKSNGNYRFAVKGAPEAVLENCTRILTPEGEKEFRDRDSWKQRSNELAAQGLRILALAQKTVDSEDAQPYEDLTFLGVVGLLDPPRQEVRAAIEECQNAGIRVIMVTGDQPVTAQNIGFAVGLTDDKQADVVQGKDLKSLKESSSEERKRLVKTPIFARVSPEQKLNLIALHQDTGAIVAMTGDGVNDAPALQKADIGVAMGQRGTQVAKEAADMVLQDDAFSSIVAAVEQGRAIFNNIRKFTVYLLSGNVGQIMAVTATSLVNVPLPILPLQILYLNIINDVFPALALGVGEGSPTLMEQPPRDSKESIITRRHWFAIVGYGLIIAAPVLGSFYLAFNWLGLEKNQAVTISFMTIAFSRLWHVFNMRDPGAGVLVNEVTRNKYVWGSLILCTGFLAAAIYLPFLSDILQTHAPSLQGWLLILAMSLVPLVIGQIAKIIAKLKKSQ